MPSGMPDSSPSTNNPKDTGSESRFGRRGTRNQDGREGGKGWNDSDPLKARKAWGIDFADKNVGVEPNEGIEGKLLSKGTKGLGEVVESSSHE
jgi:hypothetical protein